MKPFLFTLFADTPFEKMAGSSLRLITHHTVMHQISPASLSIRSTKYVSNFILVFGDICVMAPTCDGIVQMGESWASLLRASPCISALSLQHLKDDVNGVLVAA
jgi:hypothetical protein